MDAIRYYLALVMVVMLLPTFFLWLLIHPFIHFWRRLGAGLSYVVIWTLMTLGFVAVFRLRHTLLTVEFGTSYWLAGLGLALLAVSSWLGLLVWRQMNTLTIVGLPELDPGRHPGPLITTGPFAVIRNPRYVQFYLGLLGAACVANYLALYLVVALWLPDIYLIVLLEEKELRERFGSVYDDYCRRVPRFFPRLKRRSDPPEAGLDTPPRKR